MYSHSTRLGLPNFDFAVGRTRGPEFASRRHRQRVHLHVLSQPKKRVGREIMAQIKRALEEVLSVTSYRRGTVVLVGLNRAIETALAPFICDLQTSNVLC